METRKPSDDEINLLMHYATSLGELHEQYIKQDSDLDWSAYLEETIPKIAWFFEELDEYTQRKVDDEIFFAVNDLMIKHIGYLYVHTMDRSFPSMSGQIIRALYADVIDLQKGFMDKYGSKNNE